MPSKHGMLFWTLLSGILVFSITIQALLFLNWDVASLLHAARVMLAGGVYANDIFTPNTPTILYLYVPPMLVSDITGISLVYIFKSYIYLLCALSAYMSYRFIHAYFGEGDRYQAALMMLVLVFGLLVLPTYEFGNRDHLLLVFTMPYLMAVAVRLRGRQIDKYYAFTVGLFAGLGFAIKPHFMVTLLLVEMYYLFRQSSLRASFRPETYGIATVLCIYAIILLTVHTNYLTVIMPFMLDNYYSTISVTLKDITIYPLTLFCFMTIAIVTLMQKRDVLVAVMLTALIGFMASIYLQRTLFYYHFLPALTVALMLMVMQMTLLARNSASRLLDMIKLAVLASVFVAIDVSYYYTSWRYLIYYPWYFYAVFAGIFAFLLYINNHNIFSVLTRALFIVLAGALCSVLLLDTDHFTHRFLIITTLMALAYVLLSASVIQDRVRQILIVTLVISMLYVPAMLEYDLYLGPREFKTGALVKMADFINSQHEKQRLYVFSPAIYYTFPLVFYSNAVSVQRFDQLWPVMRFAKTPVFNNAKEAAIYQKSKKYFINMVAEDIRRNKPDLIMIDAVNGSRFKFDYVKFFSQNPEFSKEWKSYRYLTTLHLGTMNHIDTNMPVYQRIKSKEQS